MRRHSRIQLFVTPWTIQSMAFSMPEYWSGQPFPSPGDLPNPGIEPRSPTLQADSLPAETQGKPMNTGEGSLSLLQQTFPTQELNWGLLHCRWILYQLSYHGSHIGVQQIKNVNFKLNSKGTQPYIYMYPFSPKLPSHPGCCITLSRVPCAVQQVLVGYTF